MSFPGLSEEALGVSATGGEEEDDTGSIGSGMSFTAKGAWWSREVEECPGGG